ncbi:hypothetical protein KC878_03240 [Candidatus Saccharibacteria bacterium]|nr:hypothetical protein [Candidatus Saccharibacteria bacterium]MCB9821645.1 hypothetical protein [Candidatus Nomurabacteria bacterium]
MLPEIHWFGPGYDDAHYPDGQPETVIVYVHGWGVKWPSKGLFVDIARYLATKGHTSALFDMSDFDAGGNATFLPLTDQQDRLRAVIGLVQSIYPGVKIAFVAHSLGCRVLASLYPELERLIYKAFFLAPAVGMRHGGFMNYMARKHNAWQDADGLKFYRKDGTISLVPNRFMQEFDRDWDTIYERELHKPNNTIILAESDARTADQDKMLAACGAITLQASDHNFTGSSRASLAELIATQLA